MFHLVEKRKWYFLLSAIIIVPGLMAMIYSTATTGLPFKLAIDFTGGSIWELSFRRSRFSPLSCARSSWMRARGGHGGDHRGRRKTRCRCVSSRWTRPRSAR